jgi:DASS family divalent anion:Na+ symporter
VRPEAKAPRDRRTWLARGATLVLVAGLWLCPSPSGLDGVAWHLFALFVAAIFSVVVGALPILTASVLALAAAVLTGTLEPDKAYSGFANGTILLIVVAFLVARSVVKCGLGERLGHLVVSTFGRSTLGLGYSVFLVDGLIAPAFPSNTARSGVLYPLVLSVAEAAGARPGDEGRQRLGRFLMFSGMASLDRLLRPLVHGHGRQSPGGGDRERLRPRHRLRLLARRLLGADAGRDGPAAAPPLQGHRPRGDGDARCARAARRALEAMGPLRRDEKIVAATFIGMVVLWGAAATLGSTPPPSPSWASASCSPPVSSLSATSPRKATCWPRSSGSRCSSR